MNDLDAILLAAADCTARGERYGLATVISVRGSSYRRPGARLLVPETGDAVGLVSGGCLEGEAARMTREALARDVPLVFTIDHSQEGDEVWGSGLGCRGILELFAEPAELAADTIQALGAARNAGERTVLLTSLDGQRSRLSAEEAAALGARAEQAVERGRPVGLGDAVLVPITSPPHLVICGAGPDAPPLVEAATALGWRVTVADPRRRLLASAALEPARTVEAQPRDAADRVGRQPVSAVVIMTHDYVRDGEYLAGFLGRGIPYLGLLGPRERTDRLLTELATDGVSPSEADRAALHAPAGLDLGADGPAEVALAILAEIQATLRGATGERLRDRRGPIHAADQPPM